MITRNQKNILKYIKENPKCSQKEIAKEFGVSQQAVQSSLIALQAKGYLYWNYNHKRSYKIIKDNFMDEVTVR